MDQQIRILPWKELKKIVPLSRMHILRLEKDGKFPKRVKVSAARIGWIASEIEEFLQARAALRETDRG